LSCYLSINYVNNLALITVALVLLLPVIYAHGSQHCAINVNVRSHLQALALDERLPLVLFGSEAAAVSVAVKDTARALREQAADDEKWRQKAQQFKKGVSSFSGQDPVHFTKPEVSAAAAVFVASMCCVSSSSSSRLHAMLRTRHWRAGCSAAVH
jgi:hypothetical protein